MNKAKKIVIKSVVSGFFIWSIIFDVSTIIFTLELGIIKVLLTPRTISLPFSSMTFIVSTL